jgi:nucleoside-diphosphate-sugar epimerase
MKVLVAGGASGALGVPLTRRLIARGHRVLGLTREAAGARRLEALGAEPVVADALDRDRLLRAVDGRWADAVIHELTALRKAPIRHRGMAPTDRLRSEGTTNLLAAAEVLGAQAVPHPVNHPRLRVPRPRPGAAHRGRRRGHGGGAGGGPAWGAMAGAQPPG